MEQRVVASITQEQRHLAIETPLGPDVLLLTGFSGQEAMSSLFRYQVEMVSEDDAIAPQDIVGKNVTVSIKRSGDEPRFFNGFINRFSIASKAADLTGYRAEIVPWYWFLTQTSDCRIFQQKKLPDIIQQIFDEYGFSDYDMSQVRGSSDLHPEWDYCVQYRETDFNFISRLIEKEGICYFFRHEDGKHMLVMGDRDSVYYNCPESEVACKTMTGARVHNDYITKWEHQYEFRTGLVAQTDFNFETPSTNLLATESSIIELPGINKYEKYDYPGDYMKNSVGAALAKLRMEEKEVAHNTVMGSSTCKSFAPGGKFKISRHDDHPAEEGESYVITSIHHRASQSATYRTDAGSSAMDYQNEFHCIPDSIVFRPSRVTPKPVVQGLQTATVTGPPGEEIWPDKYGRVKVQFHWDREGQRDDKSSCWIRCMQSSAGKLWGTVFLPRIGQEVVIDFLEGDPDRPLVTGLVYNAEQMPHYKLPNEKTKSYIKTNSSPGGNGYNEIRFEDKADKEQIFIHAQNDMDARVKNNSREYVGADRHLIVKANQKELVEADKHVHVMGNHMETIDGDMSLQVGQKRHTKVGTVDATEAGQEIHLKAGMKVIIEAGAQISLVGPGGFVDIGPAGVTIQGIMVKINSGGSAGSGSGASPTDPEDGDEADNSKTGMKSAP